METIPVAGLLIGGIHFIKGNRDQARRAIGRSIITTVSMGIFKGTFNKILIQLIMAACAGFENVSNKVRYNKLLKEK